MKLTDCSSVSYYTPTALSYRNLAAFMIVADQGWSVKFGRGRYGDQHSAVASDSDRRRWSGPGDIRAYSTLN